MLVAFTYCRKDASLALDNLRWIAEMGCVKAHDILITFPEGLEFKEHESAARSAFNKVTLNPIDDVSSGWPFGANHAWRRACDYIDYFKMSPFLYMEADAIPTKPEWMNIIAAEYQHCGKPFLGYLEYKDDPQRRHMNGVGVYQQVHRLAPSLLTAPTPSEPSQIGSNHLAFDWSGKDEVVPQMHVSKLFQFQYKKEAELIADESLSWLRSDAVIFHTMKDTRFIDLLRRKLSACVSGLNVITAGTVKERGASQSAPTVVQVPPEGSTPSALITDIFIKTYAKVAPWHAQAMRSIDKFTTGFRKTVVIADQPVEGYQEMQVVKLNADLYTDADYILFTDSDCIFSRPVTPETYLREGKPIWLHRSWAAAIDQEGPAVLKWQRGMKKFFDTEPPREFMCRHPEMIPRWLLIAFRMFCQTRHGMTMEQWVLKDREFADWNMLGMYASIFHRESFYWIDQDTETLPPMTLKQFWGGHCSFEEALPEIERIINGGVDVVHVGNEKHGQPIISDDGWNSIPGEAKAVMDVRSKFEKEVEAPKPKPKKKQFRKIKQRTPEQQQALNERMARARAAIKVKA